MFCGALCIIVDKKTDAEMFRCFAGFLCVQIKIYSTLAYSPACICIKLNICISIPMGFTVAQMG